MDDEKVRKEEPNGPIREITDKMAEIFVGHTIADIMMALTNMAAFSCVQFSNSWDEAYSKKDAVAESLDIVLDTYYEDDPGRYGGEPPEPKETLQ